MLKQFIRYVSLNIVGMIGISLYILADTFFVANGLGANGLTALNLALPMFNLVSGLGMMLGIGGATRYSIMKQTASREEVDRLFGLCIETALVISIVFIIIAQFFSVPISRMLGADDTVIGETSTYFKVLISFAPVFMTNYVLQSFVRNDGNPNLSMIGTLAGSLSNIVLDYIFIFPCKMGMFGAALATGTTPMISILILSTHFIRKKNGFGLRLTKLKITEVFHTASLGISSLIGEVSSGVVMLVLNILLLKIAGNLGVAAYGIVANIAIVELSIFNGLSQGMQPLLSTACGTNDKAGAKKIYHYGLVTAVMLAVATYIFIYCFAEPAASIFDRDGNARLVQMAAEGLRLYFLGFVFAGFNLVTAMFFSATDRPKPAFVISILRGVVLIVLCAIVLSNVFGLNGVWMAFAVTEALTMLVALAFVRRDRLNIHNS